MPGSAGAAPLPLKSTSSSPSGALLKTFKTALREPWALGANRSLIVHVAPGAIVSPAQESAALRKSSAWLPATLTRATTRGALPELVSVSVRAAPIVPVASMPKPRLAGEGTTPA